MIYLETSVALAHLLSETRRPPDTLWKEELVSSSLLEYEIWNRLHARNLGRAHGDKALALLAEVSLLELTRPVLARALEPFPTPVRALDALHLASIEFLRSLGTRIEFATYDARMLQAAHALAIPLFAL